MTENPNTKEIKKDNHLGWVITEKIYGGEDEYDWDITTLKQYDGFVTCVAQAGEIDPMGFTFLIAHDPRLELQKVKARATRKVIEDTHQLGILKFQNLRELGELPRK